MRFLYKIVDSIDRLLDSTIATWVATLVLLAMAVVVAILFIDVTSSTTSLASLL